MRSAARVGLTGRGEKKRASEGDVFALRVVTIDYYLANPVPGLDVTHSAFLGAPVDKVRRRKGMG